MSKEEEPFNVKEGFKLCLRLSLALVAIAGLVFAIATTMGCDFLYYGPPSIPPGAEILIDPEFINVTSAYIGLYRYDPDGLGCRSISDDFDNLGGVMTAARTGSSLALVFSIIGLTALFLDCCCCRFPLSRPLIAICFLLASITQALTFLMYANDICEPPYRNGPYPCDSETGTIISAIATILFLVTSFLSCCVPRPKPIIKEVRSLVKNDEHDPCCACWKKKTPEEEEEAKKVAEEKAAAMKEAEEEEPLDELGVSTLEAYAAERQALVAVRLGKQQEIEKQLTLLGQYKDDMPEEDYNERVSLLLTCLPNPATYDKYTKTEFEEPEPEPEEEEGEEEPEEKKGFVSKTMGAMGSAASKVKSAVKRSKKVETGQEAETTQEATSGTAEGVDEGIEKTLSA